jgi:hypothetical protein
MNAFQKQGGEKIFPKPAILLSILQHFHIRRKERVVVKEKKTTYDMHHKLQRNKNIGKKGMFPALFFLLRLFSMSSFRKTWQKQ